MARTVFASGSIPGTQSKLLGQAKLRLGVVALVFMLGYLAISLRLVDLTLLRDIEDTAPPAPAAVASGDKTAAAAAPKIGALRGSIVDRDGELMATSLRMASVYADATLVRDPAVLAKQLSKILTGEKEKDLLTKLSSKRKFIWIARNITPRQVQAINTMGEPSLSFQDESPRIYPHGNLTS